MNTNSSEKSYNRSGFYFFLASIIFSCLWAMYFLVFKNHIDLGEYKKDSSRQNQQTQKDQEQTGPLWISSSDLISKGQKLYKSQCAVCHGAKGLGDGTPGLIPPPRNLVEGNWQKGGSSKELFITLQKGIEGTSMISYQHLSKEDRWALVHYIRSITKNKVSDNATELEEFAKQAE